MIFQPLGPTRYAMTTLRILVDAKWDVAIIIASKTRTLVDLSIFKKTPYQGKASNLLCLKQQFLRLLGACVLLVEK